MKEHSCFWSCFSVCFYKFGSLLLQMCILSYRVKSDLTVNDPSCQGTLARLIDTFSYQDWTRVLDPLLTWLTVLRYSKGARLLRFKNHLQPGSVMTLIWLLCSVLLGEHSCSLASAARRWWWDQGEGKNSKSPSSCTIGSFFFFQIYINLFHARSQKSQTGIHSQLRMCLGSL